jgi:branched-chain amino acid transport system permease protein
MLLKAGSRSILVLIAVLIVLAIVPFFAGLFYQTFLTEILIWALFALYFDLLFGYTGMLSFGQALFFGLGGYAISIPIIRLGAGTGTCIILSILIPMVFAWFVGYFSVKLSGIHFVIITIIFALIGNTLGDTWTSLTGGDDGMAFTVSPLNLGIFEIDLMNISSSYWLVLGLVTLSYLFLVRLVESPLGKIFISIRENEERAELIGYNTRRYKLFSFIIAGGLSGLSGGLYSLTLKYSSADFLHWSISGHGVLYTIVGGTGTLSGPILGTVIIRLLEHHLTEFLMGTDLVVGIVLVAMVLLAPQGLVGLIKSVGRKESKHA